VHDRQVEVAREGDTLRAAVDHRLGTHVDGHAGHLAAPELAAGAVGRLEQQDVAAGVGQVAGRGQPSDATTDHDRSLHAPSLPDRNQLGTRRVGEE
jgi:hypothetical protein